MSRSCLVFYESLSFRCQCKTDWHWYRTDAQKISRINVDWACSVFLLY